MSAKILEGKFFAQQLKDDAGRRAAALQEKYGRAPGLAVIRRMEKNGWVALAAKVQ